MSRISEEESPLWYSSDQLHSLSKTTNTTIDDIYSYHIDVTTSCSSSKSKQSLFRLRRGSKIYSMAKKSHPLQPEPISIESISDAENAAAATCRWCSNFVRDLNLCPWAKQSLLSENAIRIKVLNQSDGLDAMEEAVKESAMELKDLTDRGIVDPYIGISFIISLPDCGILGKDTGKGFDFVSFYEFFNDLEEQFLDEVIDDTDTYIGDEVTVAPFHPDWSFAPSNDADYEGNIDEKIVEDPINYEKRTPLPTISIVMSKGIDLAGEEMTSKIGIHNEEILYEMGSVALEELYNTKVLKEPIN